MRCSFWHSATSFPRAKQLSHINIRTTHTSARFCHRFWDSATPALDSASPDRLQHVYKSFTSRLHLGPETFTNRLQTVYNPFPFDSARPEPFTTRLHLVYNPFPCLPSVSVDIPPVSATVSASSAVCCNIGSRFQPLLCQSARIQAAFSCVSHVVRAGCRGERGFLWH